MTNEIEEKPEKSEETPTKKDEKKTHEKKKTKHHKKEAAAKNLDPTRFQGDGMTFKAKLIGTDEVDEPRGDALCQRTMQKLKAGVKAQGPHKQRILVRISLTGLKIVDEKTGNTEHEHAVHRISFISRDITDTRAFGYIYGNGDGSEKAHKFYAIKTEKSAETVVLSLRDLFSVVYELKKKEMEAARAKQEDHTYENMDGIKSATGDNGSAEHIYEVPKSNEPVVRLDGDVRVACLLDLETELENISQGIAQMDAFSDPFVLLDSGAESAPADPSDPFGNTAWKPKTPDPFVVNMAATSALMNMPPLPGPHTTSLAPPPTGPMGVLAPPGPAGAPPASPPTDLNTTADNPFNDDPFFVSSTPAPKQQQQNVDKYSAFQELSIIDTNASTTNTFLETSATSNTTFMDSHTTMNQAFAASAFEPPLTPMQTQAAENDESKNEPEEEEQVEVDLNDPFRELCPLGKKNEKKKPKQMFAEMQPAPPRKTLNQIIQENKPPEQFEVSDDPFAVAPSPVRKPHPPIQNPTFHADFSTPVPDPTNPFQQTEKPQPAAVDDLSRQGAISPPSPDIPPPPLPTEVALQNPPAPPPRPRPAAAKPLPNTPALIQPPTIPKKENQTIKMDTDDPFASDPFFTQPFGEENNNKGVASIGGGGASKIGAGDPFAVFDKAGSSPFVFGKEQTEEDVYATVSKPKRSA